MQPRSTPPGSYSRLTQPLVRENGVLRPASWDEALEVDYKSNDLAAPGRLATLTELYRPQIELYALAARQAGFVEPNEATLYFLNGPTPVSTPIDGRRLEVVESQAEDALGRIGRSAWDTEPGEKCRRCGYRKRGYCEVGKRFEE